MLLACQPVLPLGQDHPSSGWYPRGHLERVIGGSGSVRVTGWAAETNRDLDPGRRPHVPSRVVLLINGRWVSGSFEANLPRPDVDAAFARLGYDELRRPGSPYGFDVTVPTSPGTTAVCVSVINTMYPDWGDHVFLGCRTITVA